MDGLNAFYGDHQEILAACQAGVKDCPMPSSDIVIWKGVWQKPKSE